MSWARLDDGYFTHPKCIRAGMEGRSLHLAAITYSARELTDGFIERAFLPMVAVFAGVANVEQVAESLVSVGLFEHAEGGYQVHDYLEYNPSREDVLAEREAAKERMRRVREQKANNRPRSPEVRPNIARSSPSPVPVPNPEGSNEPKVTPPVVPQAPEPPKPSATTQPKPRSDKQKQADAVYERKMLIVGAYFRGLGIQDGSLPWNQRKGKALGALSAAILDSPECVPEIIEPLSRYTKSAFDWRHGKRTPDLVEVLAAFAEWDQLGRPVEVNRQARAPAQFQQRKPGTYSAAELAAMAQQGGGHGQNRDDEAALDTRFRLVQ